MHGFKRFLLGFIIAACLVLSATPLAFGAGTGDDPRRTEDVISPSDAAAKAADDALFESWKKDHDAVKAQKKDKSGDASGTLGALATPAIVSMWTPSHPQERSYWCGPATCQIVTHYFGRLVPQWAFAQYMGTTTAGTDFSVVDDALRYYSFKSYWYTGGVRDFGVFMDMCEFGMGSKGYPSVADVKIMARDWPNYMFDHDGHIVPIEAYDETKIPYTVRLNDPYDESKWAGGGNTYGHKTYAAYVVAKGVMSHWRQAMVR